MEEQRGGTGAVCCKYPHLHGSVAQKMFSNWSKNDHNGGS
jgi:hypothetical protein